MQKLEQTIKEEKFGDEKYQKINAAPVEPAIISSSLVSFNESNNELSSQEQKQILKVVV